MAAKRRVKKSPPRRERARVLSEGRAGIVAVDPGGTTGFFAGVVDLRSSMKLTVPTLEKESLLVGQMDGSFRRQAILLAETTLNWFAAANMDNVSLANMHVVVEDFILRRRTAGEGATGDLTSCWVAAAFDVLLIGAFNSESVDYVQASQAKGYATDDRLKSWGLYDLTKGKPHARDASRHWATKVNQLIK